jgi:dephospho-CoA kinase
MVRVGLTGGIGSGKSTVARVFEALGAGVYNADARAKELMASDPRIVAELTELLGPAAYRDGLPDRAWIAARVFDDKNLLARLNAIVHPRVAEDWKQFSTSHFQFSILEAAILFESGFEALVDYVVSVEAPVEQRVARAAARDGVEPADIRRRVANQMSDSERAARADFVIDNSDGTEVLPQILAILHEIKP